MHVPVLLKETIEILNPQPGEFFIDGTIGGGGHAVEILKRIGPKGKLLGIDWDRNAIANCEAQMANRRNVILVNGNYANVPEILKKYKLSKASGLLLDLGFSSEQLEGKGISFLKNENLDMRYDSESKNPTAAEIINTFTEKDLAEIFWKYGEERYSRKIARKIIEERKKKIIKTTFDLVELIRKSVPRNYQIGRINPATKIFQALRIYVNHELENLEKLLKNSNKIVKGRIVIISYHSLEDRLVKNYFRELKNQGRTEILTKKPIRPTNEEIQANPRSRSAKLRAITLI